MTQETSKLVEAMRASGLEYFGIRVADADCEIGSYMDSSWDWTLDIIGEEREQLNGSSTIQVCEAWELDDEDVADKIREAMEMTSRYVGDNTYLVGGDTYEWGNDDGEWVISNVVSLMDGRVGAKVVAIL